MTLLSSTPTLTLEDDLDQLFDALAGSFPSAWDDPDELDALDELDAPPPAQRPLAEKCW